MPKAKWGPYHSSNQGGFELLLKGWEESIGEDDIRVGYGPDLARRSLVSSEVLVINQAIEEIGIFWTEHDRLPFEDEGANAINTPGMPKAKWGPYHSSNQGVSSVDKNAPVLIEK